jgi:quinolinate synthase
LVNTLDKNKQIIFVPDKYLGGYVAEKTGRNIILWPGYCPTHARISAEQIEQLKAAHPGAVAIAHPECNEQVAHVADEILSTGQMLKFLKTSDAKTFIVATELGIIHTMKKENPDKEFIPVAANIICPNMKKITLEKVLWALEDMRYEITVSKEIAERARGALDRMIEVMP